MGEFDGSGAIATAAEIGVSAVVIPIAQFVPLIKDVADILAKVTELYSTAQHNKKIVELLMGRIAAANSSVSILQGNKLHSKTHFAGLQRLTQVLRKMVTFVKDITEYNKVQKLLGAKTIESKYNELCREFDSSVTSLNLSLMIDFKMNAENERQILKNELEDLTQFQKALAEGVDENNEKLDKIVTKISEMQITMQRLDDEKSSQEKIDAIFSSENLLPFEEYAQAPDEPRSDRLRKYTHLKNKQEFAFKVVEEELFNQVKNQVTILKKLKDCQNIIRFYGLTYSDDDDKYYLVTEWAENKNLREYIAEKRENIDVRLKIRLAYDITLGLNFLNSVKVVHRDIRADNIVITEHGVAKITNFKLSRSMDAATANLTATSEGVRYCAPEILMRKLKGEEGTKDKEGTKEGTKESQKENQKKSQKECKKYNTKCEVYSFGIVLWEIAECKIPYEILGDFMEISQKVANGYREPFTPGTDVPKKYQSIVSKAVDQNPDLRPTFAKMLTDLQDLKNLPELKRNNSSNSVKNVRAPPERKMTAFTLAAAEEDCALFSIDTELDQAIKDHKENIKDKRKLYKIFDSFADMGIPKAKYYKAYFITKGWADLTCSKGDQAKMAIDLFKEVADYGDEFPDAQLRYGTMTYKTNEEEAIEYFSKAAKNGHVVAMFNLGTYYITHDNEELGKFHLTRAASKDHKQAIAYCQAKNITF